MRSEDGMRSVATLAFEPSTGRRAPLVRGWPVVGSSFALARDPVRFWARAARQYGPVFRVRYVTAPAGEVTVMAGVEANRFATRYGAEVFTNRQYFQRLTREVETDKYMCALDGEEHAHFRKIMRPALSREALAPFVPDMIEASVAAARSWAAGESFPVKRRIQRLSLDNLSLASAGCAITEAQYAHLGRFANTFIGSGVAGRPGFLLKMPGYLKAKQKVHDFLSDFLAEHERTPPGAARRTDLMDVVLSGAYPDGCPFGQADRLANAHLPYANGLAYGGRVGAFLLYGLLKNPNVLSRVVEEVDAAFAQGTPTAKQLRAMTTLRNALKETYRLYPVAPVVPRYAARDFEFAGYRIRRGSYVFVAVSVPLFDARHFTDPEKFDPDRFAPPRSEGVQANAFSPFGLGTHACLSIGMMEMMVMATMCGLLRTLELEIDPPDYEIETEPKPIPGPKDSFRIRVRSHRAHDERATAGAPPALDPDMIPIAGLELSSEELARFASGVARRTYKAGALIIREGDKAEDFFVIVDGEVEIVHDDGESGTEHVAQIAAGGYFGEIGLLYGVPRTATVRAGVAGPVTVLAIGRAFFAHMVSEHDLVSDEIAEMARRRMLVNQLANAVPGLDTSRLRAFSERIARERYAAGEVVIHQGDEAHTFYVIADGEAEVVNRHPSGADLVLARLGAGEYFGEIGILQNRPRTATVRAVGNRGLEVLAIDKATLLEMREATSDSGRAIAEKALVRLVEIQAAQR